MARRGDWGCSPARRSVRLFSGNARRRTRRRSSPHPSSRRGRADRDHLRDGPRCSPETTAIIPEEMEHARRGGPRSSPARTAIISGADSDALGRRLRSSMDRTAIRTMDDSDHLGGGLRCSPETTAIIDGSDRDHIHGRLGSSAPTLTGVAGVLPQARASPSRGRRPTPARLAVDLTEGRRSTFQRPGSYSGTYDGHPPEGRGRTSEGTRSTFHERPSDLAEGRGRPLTSSSSNFQGEDVELSQGRAR